MGKNYIAPIYCKFVHRKLANLVLQRRDWLHNVYNKFGTEYEVRENLTLQKKILFNSIDKKLEGYQKWIHNSKTIFVKKNSNSAPIKVNSSKTIDDIINSLPQAAEKTLPSTVTEASNPPAPSQNENPQPRTSYAQVVSAPNTNTPKSQRSMKKVTLVNFKSRY